MTSLLFFKIFSKIFQNFSANFSIILKLKKLLSCTQISPKYFIDQIRPNFPLKLPKIALFFKKFGPFGAENLEFYDPKPRSFWSWGLLLGRGSLPKYTMANIVLYNFGLTLFTLGFLQPIFPEVGGDAAHRQILEGNTVD